MGIWAGSNESYSRTEVVKKIVIRNNNCNEGSACNKRKVNDTTEDSDEDLFSSDDSVGNKNYLPWSSFENGTSHLQCF